MIRQAVEQFGVPLETRDQALVVHAVPAHHIRQHDLMGRFRNGDGRGDAVHAAQLNPLEQV
jgi:hypothetical protein